MTTSIIPVHYDQVMDFADHRARQFTVDRLITSNTNFPSYLNPNTWWCTVCLHHLILIKDIIRTRQTHPYMLPFDYIYINKFHQHILQYYTDVLYIYIFFALETSITHWRLVNASLLLWTNHTSPHMTPYSITSCPKKGHLRHTTILKVSCTGKKLIV